LTPGTAGQLGTGTPASDAGAEAPVNTAAEAAPDQSDGAR
jgi:hypothetical protein